MRSYKPGLLFAVAVCCLFNVRSQDKIYFATKVDQGDVQDITPDIVKFTPVKSNSKSVYLDTKKIILLFNTQGNFLIPARMDFNREQSQQLIKNFLHPADTKKLTDQIYTRDKQVIEANVLLEDKSFVHYSVKDKQGKLEKGKVVVIIYRAGNHMIHGTTAEAAEILWNNQQKLLNSVQNGNPVSNDAGKKPDITNAKIATGETHNETDSTKPLTFGDVAPHISQQEFKDKATHKTTLFSGYLKILCNKQAADIELDKATEGAISLFVSENAEVETASVTRDITSKKKIRKYLENVRFLRYDRIELEWTRVQYASDIKLGPDGNYHGIVSFEQVFKGFRDGKLIYEDITRKDAQVVLKTYEKSIDGNSTLAWDVLLSDIGVTSYE